MTGTGTEGVSVETLLGALREARCDVPVSWDGQTTIVEVRDLLGEFAVLLLVAHVEQATAASGEWPLELIDACDTLGMLADFAQVRS